MRKIVDKKSINKVLVLDAFSTIHVGNGVLLSNSINLCKDIFKNPDISILTLDKETNEGKFDNVKNDIFHNFPRNRGLLAKIFWLSSFFLFIFTQLALAKFTKSKGEWACFNKEQKELLNEINESDACISISGENINDFYYPRMYQRLLIFKLCILKGKKVYIFPQSIGPIFRGVSKKILRWAIGEAKVIAARDYKSYELAKTIFENCKATTVYSPDVGVLQQSEKISVNECYFENENPTLGLTISAVPKEIKNIENYDLKICEAIFKSIRGLNINVLLMPSNYTKTGVSDDYKICEKALVYFKDMGIEANILPNQVIFEDEYQGLQKSLKMFISTRMHVGILSTTAAVPTIMINSQHKIKGYMDNIDSGQYTLEYEEIESNLSNLITNLLDDSTNKKYRDHLATQNSLMKDKMKPFINLVSKEV